MKSFSGKHAVFTIVVLLLVATASVKAETTETGAIPGVSVKVPASAFGRLNTSLPQISGLELIAKMQAYRQKLENNRSDLVQMLEDNKIKASDVVLTAILPGGLLYAAYRTSQQASTRQQLADVEALIQELGTDLVALEAGTGKIMVAKWP